MVLLHEWERDIHKLELWRDRPDSRKRAPIDLSGFTEEDFNKAIKKLKSEMKNRLDALVGRSYDCLQ